MPRRIGKLLLLKKIQLNRNTFLTCSTMVVFKHINLVMMKKKELQTTNFFLFMECISGDSTGLVCVYR